MADILHRVKILTEAETVHKAVATIDGLQNWWTRETTGSTSVGEHITFGFGNNQFQIRMKVTKDDGSKRVEWICEEDPSGAWNGTKLHFDLETVDGGTMLRFGHTGWEEATDFYAQCNTKWGQFLLSLKELAEKGKGSPHPEDIPL
jgi:activator of Hsp90 ATPase-like protein